MSVFFVSVLFRFFFSQAEPFKLLQYKKVTIQNKPVLVMVNFYSASSQLFSKKYDFRVRLLAEQRVVSKYTWSHFFFHPKTRGWVEIIESFRFLDENDYEYEIFS